VRVGVVILPDEPWDISRHKWAKAESLGFAHAWTYDHIGWRDLISGPWFDGLITLTAAAHETSSIRLGTHVLSANYRHPVVLSRELTAIDDISNGRLVIGIGAGGAGYDAKVLGVQELPARQRADRFREFAILLDQILVSPSTTWQGTYYSAVDARSHPGCVQHPRAPLVLAANGRRSIALAASMGDGWMTNGIESANMRAWWADVAWKMATFQDSLDRQGRALSDVTTYLSVDPAPIYSMSSPTHFRAIVKQAQQLGFTDIVAHWPRRTGWYAGREEVLVQIASETDSSNVTASSSPVGCGSLP
jgi:alkanesulfonate monooxygenase SsuD/methylene tetrahydromethanopterin reductase-like flavin-dependent oxidoreductase (luciferase family)